MIDQGYSYNCKDSVGGVKNLYISTHSFYTRKQINITNGVLDLHPRQVVYKFNTLQGASFNETFNNDAYDQNITASFIKTGENLLEDLAKERLLAIVEGNNGLYHYVGLYNGLDAKINKQLGANKNELNGYQITFEGKEKITAPTSQDLNSLGIGVDSFAFLSSTTLLSSTSNLSSQIEI